MEKHEKTSKNKTENGVLYNDRGKNKKIDAYEIKTRRGRVTYRQQQSLCVKNDACQTNWIAAVKRITAERFTTHVKSLCG